MEYHFFLLLPVVVIIAWLVVFVVTGHYRQLHDRLILAMLGCSAVTMYTTIRALVDGTDGYGYVVFDNIETVLGLAVCPLLFLYMRTVARDAKWHRWYVWLFVPSLVLGIAGTVLSIAVGWDRVLVIRNYDSAVFDTAQVSGVECLYRLVNITLFNCTLEVMAVVLMAWSVLYLIIYRRHIGNYFANIENTSLRYLHVFLMSTILLLVIIFLVTFFIRDIIDMNRHVFIGIAFVFAFLAWLIANSAYKMELTDQHLQALELLEEPKEHNDMDDLLSQRIASWQVRDDKPFCKEGITLADVATDMNVSQRVLSAYINKHLGMNFNRWINTLRIQKAKAMLTDERDIKIGYISTVCGYANQAAFSKAFKMIEGCSPQDYRNNKDYSN